MNDAVSEPPATQQTGPLRGHLVLDFGQAAVGPVATEFLGMLGATVIKVEAPKGDTVRNGAAQMQGTSTTFIGNNLTKFGVMLDLKSPEDNARAKKLIAIADVLVENFRSNEVMVRLGLGYDVLKRLNPGLVYVASSAYGNGGPLENMRSNEWLTEALSGFVSVTGGKDGAGEMSRGTANMDWHGAMVNTAALLSVLVRRARGAEGGHLQTSQLGSSIYGGITRFAEVLAGRSAPVPMGAASRDIVPDDGFATRDGHIVVSALTERCWARLCHAIGQPALQDDPRFATNAARVRHRNELTGLLAGIFAGDTGAAWCERLGAADVPCAPVPKGMTLLETLNANPQVRAKGLLSYVPSAYGVTASHSPPWRFARTPAAIEGGAPLKGEHNELVFAHLDDKASLIAALEAIRPRGANIVKERV